METHETATPAPEFPGILLHKAQLAAWRLASSEASRPQLNGIHLRPDGSTCATNGHALIIIGPPEKTEAYPAPDGWQAPIIPTDGVIIPTETARQAEKNLPKGRAASYHPFLASALVESLNGTVRLSSTDLDTRKVAEAKPLEGPFPHVEQVIPKGEPVLRIAFNAALLRNVLETLLATGRSVTDRAIFEFHNPNGAAVITYQGDNLTPVKALVMPLRLSEPEAK